MHKLKSKMIIIITMLMMLLISTSNIYAAENATVNNDNSVLTQEKKDGTANTLLTIKDEQLKSIEDYKVKYGNDTYGVVAYILHLVQVYSIPLGIVGIAFCAIFQYVIGLKRLDIRDKGFGTMVTVITLIIICQILPLVFAIVVKSND